jgi:hexosaminidase
VEVLAGAFTIAESTVISFDHRDGRVRPIATYLSTVLRDHTGYSIPIAETWETSNPRPNSIVLRATGAASPSSSEAYELRVTPESMTLTAPTAKGLFHGVQTIRQLLPLEVQETAAGNTTAAVHRTIPCVNIKDKPRYRWRGMLLDCGRHFMTKDFVKRYIDLLAYHKMNVLHWHLTEDQGWRIEIKKHPKLTRIGAWRGENDDRYGGFYTQHDIREIVEYAQSRHVTVVPEIEMPGHSLAALASYPELGCQGEGYKVGTQWGVHGHVYCAGNDEVFSFLEDVLSEVIALFPSEYIHIGGDECPKTQWKQCEKCQERIAMEGLNDEHELQSYFIRRIGKFLNSRGRRLIGWDEILEGGLAPNATVQSWRGMNGAIAAATAGHDVISSPTSHCYLDYAQSRNGGEPTQMGYLPLERCYAFEPTPAQLTPGQGRHILGLEGNMWTEHAPQERVDWQVFPRLCALAEVGWSPKDQREWSDFSERMKVHYRRLDALGVTYFLSPPLCTSRELVFTDSISMVLENPMGRGAIHYTLDGSEPTSSSPKYLRPMPIAKTTVVRARSYLPGGRASSAAEFHFRKMHPREPVRVQSATPGLAYEYYEGSWRRLPEFDKLLPVTKGVATTFGVDLRERDDEFALRFNGYLLVPTDGTYTFYLVSDDGSRLWIGSDLVVDYDGLHSASEVSGQVILKAGMHPIAVAHFESGGAQHLEVIWEGPGIAKQPVAATALWRGTSD